MGDAAILVVLATIVGLFGAGFAVPAAFMLERRLKALRFGTKVIATVARLDLPPPWPGGIQPMNNVPWVRYRSADSQEHEALLAPPHPRRISYHFPVGKQLEVRVDPLRPDVAFQAGLIRLLLGPSVMLFGGCLSLLIAWAIFRSLE
jgi:hypothetical protein